MDRTRRLALHRAAALVAACTGAHASQAAGEKTTWDLPTAYPLGNFHTENLAQFAADVAHASGGRLSISVHANASLFKAPEIKRAVQGRQAQAGEILLVNHQNEWQLYGADSLPFLASSYEESARLYKAQKPLLENKLAEQGMLLLYSVPWPPQGLFAKRQLNSIADLKSIKWRAYSPATSRIAELIGAKPVTVQAAELPQALATGLIESYMSSGSTGYDSRSFEHLKYFYDVQAWLPKNTVLVNKAAFDALDRPVRAALVKAAADAERRGWLLSHAQNSASLELLRKNGMQVLAPSAQLKSDLERVGEVMLQEWLQRAGPEGHALIDGYRRG